jgi:hypothetical protein
MNVATSNFPNDRASCSRATSIALLVLATSSSTACSSASDYGLLFEPSMDAAIAPPSVAPHSGPALVNDGGEGRATDASSARGADGGAPPVSVTPPSAFDAGGDADSGSSMPPSEAHPIYLVSNVNEMYTFDPSARHMVDLGAFSCPGEPTPPNPVTGSGVANSMAVDGDGVAWVNFRDGAIFRVNTATLVCTSTSFQSGQAGFTPALGMAFAGQAPGSATLYVSDNGGLGGLGGVGKGLAWIDTATMTLHPIGPYTDVNAGYDAELTASPTGDLYGVFAPTPSDIAEISVATGATPKLIDVPGLSGRSSSCDPNAWVFMGSDENACAGFVGESCGWTQDNDGQGYHCAITSWGTGCEPGGVTCGGGGGYAVSFWGGSFWLFSASPSASDPNPTSTVTQYDAVTGMSVVVIGDVGATIVGASAASSL